MAGPVGSPARLWRSRDSQFTSLVAFGNMLGLDPLRPLSLSLLCYVARFHWSARLASANVGGAGVHDAFLRVRVALDVLKGMLGTFSPFHAQTGYSACVLWPA